MIWKSTPLKRWSSVKTLPSLGQVESVCHVSFPVLVSSIDEIAPYYAGYIAAGTIKSAATYVHLPSLSLPVCRVRKD